MQSTKFDIQTKDGICDCFAAYPEEGKSYPAVLFFMDGFGPRKYLYDMAEKLASNGYYVLLPNMFYRQRRAPVIDAKFPITKEAMPEARKQIMPLFASYDPEFGVQDAGLFLDFISKQKQVRAGPIGLTGYCMGGGLALRTAEKYPDRVAAAASFHGGRLATDAETSPHRFVKQVKARLYFAHADADESMPAEQIERLDEALKEAQIKYESELYSGATHGFTMADLPAYNEAALRRHWEKLLPLFKETLKNA